MTEAKSQLPCQVGTRGALRKSPCISMTNDEKCRRINNLKDPGLLEMVSDLHSAAGQPGLQALFSIRGSSVETTGPFGRL